MLPRQIFYYNENMKYTVGVKPTERTKYKQIYILTIASKVKTVKKMTIAVNLELVNLA